MNQQLKHVPMLTPNPNFDLTTTFSRSLSLSMPTVVDVHCTWPRRPGSTQADSELPTGRVALPRHARPQHGAEKHHDILMMMFLLRAVLRVLYKEGPNADEGV